MVRNNNKTLLKKNRQKKIHVNSSQAAAPLGPQRLYLEIKRTGKLFGAHSSAPSVPVVSNAEFELGYN